MEAVEESVRPFQAIVERQSSGSLGSCFPAKWNDHYSVATLQFAQAPFHCSDVRTSETLALRHRPVPHEALQSRRPVP